MIDPKSKGGFTLLEMLVASLLLSMMVVALSQVFSSTASAWRIGRAGVDGLHKVRHQVSSYQFSSDNAVRGLKTDTDIAFVCSVWYQNNQLKTADGTKSLTRGFVRSSEGRSLGFDTDAVSNNRLNQYKECSGIGTMRGNSYKNYIVGVGSAGPDHEWNTEDDIATWPSETGGGL